VTDKETIRACAQRRAQECIDDWAITGWNESNEIWGTDFTEEELREIHDLAAKAKAVLPDE
jgi:hypothetical protein